MNTRSEQMNMNRADVESTVSPLNADTSGRMNTVTESSAMSPSAVFTIIFIPKIPPIICFPFLR